MNKIVKAIVASSFIGASAIGVNAAVDIEWFNGGGSTPAINRFGNTLQFDAVGNVSQNGALFQLIRSVNGVDEAPALGELGTGDGIGGGSDDVVVWSDWAGEGGTGDAIISQLQTIAALSLSDFIYVRVWQDPSATTINPATGTPGAFIPSNPNGAYWDTTPIQVSSLPINGPLRTYDFASPTAVTSGTHTQNAWVAVPEPTTYAFMGIGALLFAIRRFRRS